MNEDNTKDKDSENLILCSYTPAAKRDVFYELAKEAVSWFDGWLAYN